jgi:signal transduction histidine kinase
MKRIFEPYERSDQAATESPTGVGIGLYVSRLLARLMGGDLDCVRPNGMTVFRLQLPAAVEPALQPVRERHAS